MKTFNEWLRDKNEITEGETWDTWRPAAWLDGRVPQGFQKKLDQKFARELGGFRGYDSQGNPIDSPEQQYSQQQAQQYSQQQAPQAQAQQPQAQAPQAQAPQRKQSGLFKHDYRRDGFSDEEIIPNSQGSEMASRRFDQQIKDAEQAAGTARPAEADELWKKVEQIKRQRAAWSAAISRAAGRG